jgi:NADPH:quinone reductase-like Zn-dependent oxidoreductase
LGGTEVLRLAEVDEPQPGAGELLVAVKAAGLNPKDVLQRKGKLWWLSGRRFPRGTGFDWAGDVLAIGAEVTSARVGDRLFGMMNGQAGGSVAERLVVRADECAPMPAGLSYVEAASLPLAAQTALQGLRDDGRLRPRQSVLLLGASGGVGVHAVQLAKALGGMVTASSSTANLALLRALGADEVIDYKAQDPLDGGPYDLIFDIFGNRRFAEAEPALAERGHFVGTVPSAAIALATLRTLGRARRAHLVVVRSRRGDLIELAGLVERGQLRPVIDSVFAIDQVAAAHARIETKRSRGKVVVSVVGEV